MTNLALARLQFISQSQKLPHAWLFTDGALDQQLQTAQTFSNWLICANRLGEVACAKCRSCQLFAAGTHPDIHTLTLQEDNSSILVDDVRIANDFAHAKPQLAEYKIITIYPAERMNTQAANALLKTLEEPPPQTLLLLLTRHHAMLLPTIVSRCTRLRFQSGIAVSATENEQIQQLIADLQSLYLVKSVTSIQLVDVWVKRGADEMLYWFELVLADLLLGIYTRDLSLTKYANMYKNRNELVHAIGLDRFWIMLQKIQQARYWLGKGMKPNLQLLLEDIFL